MNSLFKTFLDTFQKRSTFRQIKHYDAKGGGKVERKNLSIEKALHNPF